ncbi:transcriptional regulator [Paenibacillus sp. LC231]|uniref:LysR family transcriptional regulator n=1 Tax=Paenibacillus sp. LC231 TaxID=1120679 RepID=UPI0008DE56A0|nr:LysR family transcriptional regulator [Paenibacillus sp. LC231]OIB02340.1 transcriptional regulator [Paenibacillus sp. LC231]
MDLKALKTFQLIVKYGSFIRAAQEMNYAQSTVTMQIQKLESELGTQLIQRGKEISLTEAGRLFYDQSLQIIKSIEHLQTSLSDLKSGESGHIRLGVTEPTASYRLPAILGKFMSMHPNIRISVDISNTSTLSERVQKGEIDFALCTAPELRSGLFYEPLFEEEFVALMPENHPLAQKAVIMPDDFQGYRLLITSAICPYRRKLEMVLQETGNVVLETMEIGSMTALKFYVENGLGIALVPKIMVEPEATGTIARIPGGSLIHMNFGMLCKESDPQHMAVRKLYKYLKDELRRNIL